MTGSPTTTGHGTAGEERPSTTRLALWLCLVGLLIASAYYGRAVEGKPDPNTLYRYGTATGSLVLYAIVLAVVLAIASLRTDWLALRRPARLGHVLGLALAVFVALQVFDFAYAAVVHLGNEQGLTPDRWRPDRAGQYVANGLVICGVVPFVEEVTYRGLGYTLLSRFGRWPAILAIGILFALSHGLAVSLPILAAFGAALAWLRARTGSVFPGMVVHAVFNLFALVYAVTIGN